MLPPAALRPYMLQAFAAADLTQGSPAKAEQQLQAMISAASGIMATVADVIASLSQLIIAADIADQVQGQISQTMDGLQNITATVYEALVNVNTTRVTEK